MTSVPMSTNELWISKSKNALATEYSSFRIHPAAGARQTERSGSLLAATHAPCPPMECPATMPGLRLTLMREVVITDEENDEQLPVGGPCAFEATVEELQRSASHSVHPPPECESNHINQRHFPVTEGHVAATESIVSTSQLCAPCLVGATTQKPCTPKTYSPAPDGIIL